MLTTLTLANGTAIETTQDLASLLPLLLGSPKETPKAETPKAAATPKAATPKAKTEPKAPSKASKTPKASVAPIDKKAALSSLRLLGKSDPMAAAKQAAAFGWSQEADAWTKRAESKQEPKAAQEPKASVLETAPPKEEQVKAAKQQRRYRKADAAKQDAVAAATAKRDLAVEEQPKAVKPKAAPKAKVVRSTQQSAKPTTQEIVTDPEEFTANLFAAKTKRIIAEGGDAILSQISEWEADLADVQDDESSAEFVRRTFTVNINRLYKALDAITAA